MRFLTKWTPRDVQVRITKVVVAVPIERTGIRAIVRIATGDHQTRSPLFPILLYCWEEVIAPSRLIHDA